MSETNAEIAKHYSNGPQPTARDFMDPPASLIFDETTFVTSKIVGTASKSGGPETIPQNLMKT